MAFLTPAECLPSVGGAAPARPGTAGCRAVTLGLGSNSRQREAAARPPVSGHRVPTPAPSVSLVLHRGDIHGSDRGWRTSSPGRLPHLVDEETKAWRILMCPALPSKLRPALSSCARSRCPWQVRAWRDAGGQAVETWPGSWPPGATVGEGRCKVGVRVAGSASTHGPHGKTQKRHDTVTRPGRPPSAALPPVLPASW